jgi:hypothetical protein
MTEPTQSSVTLLDVAGVAKQLANIIQDYVETSPEQEMTETLREVHAQAFRLWWNLSGVTTLPE